MCPDPPQTARGASLTCMYCNSVSLPLLMLATRHARSVRLRPRDPVEVAFHETASDRRQPARGRTHVASGKHAPANERVFGAGVVVLDALRLEDQERQDTHERV